MTGKEIAATICAMTVPYYEVHAFTNRLFAGNPAGVCLLDAALPDDVMQTIARENNLPATAFLFDRGDSFDLRWFSPTAQLELCGHATLASGHVLFEHVRKGEQAFTFHTRAGELKVARADSRLVLDFPSRPVTPCEPPPLLVDSLGARPREVFKNGDYLAVFERAEEIAALRPNLDGLAQLPVRGVIVTAPGEDCDFVSRFFAPQRGIAEDPVTGSAHCTLAPYWAARLGRKQLHARQVSQRGGELFCEDRGDRVSIGGTAVTYIEGTLCVPNG
jgi:predicted PhzF superfamily epimerase YddE/YHI9